MIDPERRDESPSVLATSAAAFCYLGLEWMVQLAPLGVDVC
jgi:hypothetical protein